MCGSKGYSVIGVFIIYLLLAGVTVQAAEGDENSSLFVKRLYLSPSVSYFFADTGRNASDDHGVGAQLALGYNFLSNFSIEAEINGDYMDIAGGGKYNQFGAGINALARFPVNSVFEPYLLVGSIGALRTKVPGNSSTNVYLGAGVGSFIALSENVLLRLEARYRIDTDDQSIPSQDPFEDIISSIGFVVPFGDEIDRVLDDDQDSVRNKVDRCPNTPLGTEVDQVGCPLDDDRDGVNNNDDRCPGTPQGALVDIHGCEFDSDDDSIVDRLDKCPGTLRGAPIDSQGCALDTDGDKVIDLTDQCPNTPQGAVVDSVGCERDEDEDGVVNRIDECPHTPAGAKVNRVGCELDDDQDGIVNSKDLCPNTPLGTKVDETGCKLEEVITLQGLKFQFNSVELANPEENQSLQDITNTLRRYSNIKVLIVGHTDSRGAANYNLRLSLERANAIRKHLIANGVNADSLSTAGKGESSPIADNSTEAGRAANRRVELHILER